jgi:hypothetical protein
VDIKLPPAQKVLQNHSSNALNPTKPSAVLASSSLSRSDDAAAPAKFTPERRSLASVPETEAPTRLNLFHLVPTSNSSTNHTALLSTLYLFEEDMSITPEISDVDDKSPSPTASSSSKRTTLLSTVGDKSVPSSSSSSSIVNSTTSLATSKLPTSSTLKTSTALVVMAGSSNDR